LLLAEVVTTGDTQTMSSAPTPFPLSNATSTIGGENSTITSSSTLLTQSVSATGTATKSEAGIASNHNLMSASLAIFVGAGMFLF